MDEPLPARGVAPLAAGDPRLAALARLIAIVDRLRAPEGCPWDRKQTLETMAPHLVEEAHEAVEAVETGDEAGVLEESGDLLMALILLVRIAEDEGRFDLARVAGAIGDKLVRRHPHVFGDVAVDSAEAALKNWEAIKQAERAAKDADASALAGVPAALPALQRARRISAKAIAAGFRWETPRGAFDKLVEEVDELRSAFAGTPLLDGGAAHGDVSPERRRAVERELGDVLLAGGFLAEYLGLDPERLARDSLRRFESRFRSMEAALARPMREHGLAELVAAWGRAKEEVGE